MIFYIITLSAIILDWTSKRFMESFLKDWSINLVWNYLVLKLVKNSWIAFSLPLEWLILKIITVVLILLIYFYYLKFENKKDKFKDLIFGLILWWALWNWFERILFSQVTDFISVKYFAIFNFADIFINVWIILLIYTFLKNEYLWK